MRSGRTLIFVFHIDRGNLSAIRDLSQKHSEDRPPECPLHALISSPVGIKKGWKRYITQLSIPVRFLHRDEYEEEFGEVLTRLPAVFLHDRKTKSLFIAADELDQVPATEDLIALVNGKLGSLSRRGSS